MFADPCRDGAAAHDRRDLAQIRRPGARSELGCWVDSPPSAFLHSTRWRCCPRSRRLAQSRTCRTTTCATTPLSRVVRSRGIPASTRVISRVSLAAMASTNAKARRPTFQQCLVARLDRQRVPAVACVKRRLLGRAAKWGASLSLEVGFDRLDGALPIVAYATDAGGDQVGLEQDGQIFVAAGQRVFPSAMRAYTTREWRRAVEQAPDALELAAPILLRWFIKIWTKAGGPFFPLPATIELHDSKSRIDLPSRSRARRAPARVR